MSFVRKYRKQLLNKGLYSSRTASKRVVHEIGELLGYKISYAVAESNDDKNVKKNRREILTKNIDENSRSVEVIITSPEKIEQMPNELRQVFYKRNTIKYLLLSDSTECKFATRNGSKKMIYQVINVFHAKI